MSASRAPLRVLVMHSGLLDRIFEASEVWQIVTALRRVAPRTVASFSVTDCRKVWDVRLVDGRAELDTERSLMGALKDGVDVVHVHLAIPLRHVLWATLFRLRGAPVIFSPMALLGSDFARSSWFRRRHRLFRRVKPVLVRALAMIWVGLSTWVMCLSEEERRQTRVPARKSLFAPWPLPDTPLADAAVAEAQWPPADGRDRTGPLAFVARMDPWRKGIDRLCNWTASHAAALPRPAVLLLAPHSDRIPPELQAAVASGLIEWDSHTSGSDLLPRLRSCRGTVLLSRWEAQPRALREAVVLGLPTVSTPSAHFREVVDLLCFGAVVDGDDPNAVQGAFELVAEQDSRPGAAEALFGLEHQGRWLLDVYRAVGAHRRPPEPNYYRVAARLAPTLVRR